MNRLTQAFLWMVLSFGMEGCGVYSFTGASISPNDKTVFVAIFENNAKLVVPNLSQKFTEALKNQILNGTSLSFVKDPSQADIIFEGTISDYTVQPVAITGGTGQNQTQAEQQRLTITVDVKFTDVKDEKKNFEQNFNRYEDFGASVSLASIEQQYIDDINKLITQDVFNKAFVNW